MHDQRRERGEPVYQRDMPGGGFVAIFVAEALAPTGVPWYSGEIVLERRGERTRRIGHEPPVIMRVTGPNEADVLRLLFRVAFSNASVATECLRATTRPSAAVAEPVSPPASLGACAR